MEWSTSIVQVAGLDLHITQAGRGDPLILLHHDIGAPDGLPFYDMLAEDFDVRILHHPGFGRSERGDWLRSVRDVAVLYQELLARLGLRGHALLGLGFGGWIAAEMASMAPRDVSRLALLAPMGIKPPEGYIFDQALVQYIEYVRTGFHDQSAFDRLFGTEPPIELVEQWDICREMVFRLAWKPYMYSHTLPRLLGEVEVPALIVWPEEDRIVPPAAAEAWAGALRHANAATLPACGHFAEMERPAELAGLVKRFLQ